MFLKNRNIIFKMKKSKVTDYAALSIKNKCFSMCFNDNYMKYARENKPIWIKLDNIFNLSMTKCLFNNK